ncbi:MAG: zinc-ribbon domain-containing protein [Butyricicoccus sp.]|nr:zinc-ribbon domain-containing protein [Butyricicoccus sp.]
MFCKNCGTQLKDEARFCPKCGTPVGVNQQNPDNQDSYTPPQPPAPKKWKDSYTIFALIGVFAVAIALGFGAKAILQSKAQDEAAMYAASDETGNSYDDDSYSDDDSYDENSYDMDGYDDDSYNDETENEAYDAAEGGVHRYSYILDDCTWTEAFYRAREQGGYLVRINSREEYDQITRDIERMGYEKKQWFIGAGREYESTAYYWIDENGNVYGDKLNDADYWANSEWLSGEPSFRSDGVEELYVEIFYSSSMGRWVWNDCADDVIGIVPSYSGKVGYIIEYEDE